MLHSWVATKGQMVKLELEYKEFLVTLSQKILKCARQYPVEMHEKSVAHVQKALKLVGIQLAHFP